jgi:hypothetical protein
VSYSAIFLLVSYIQFLNLRIVHTSFMKARLYSERLRTEVKLFIAEVTEEV